MGFKLLWISYTLLIHEKVLNFRVGILQKYKPTKSSQLLKLQNFKLLKITDHIGLDWIVLILIILFILLCVLFNNAYLLFRQWLLVVGMQFIQSVKMSGVLPIARTLMAVHVLLHTTCNGSSSGFIQHSPYMCTRLATYWLFQ